MYRQLIAEAIDNTDPATLAVVEEFMRTDRTALDGLSRTQFRIEARTAYQDMLALPADDLAFYCEVMGLALPVTN